VGVTSLWSCALDAVHDKWHAFACCSRLPIGSNPVAKLTSLWPFHRDAVGWLACRLWRGLLLATFFNIQSGLFYELLSNFMGKGDKVRHF
jgi:hypothetical protein